MWDLNTTQDNKVEGIQRGIHAEVVSSSSLQVLANSASNMTDVLRTLFPGEYKQYQVLDTEILNPQPQMSVAWQGDSANFKD